MIFDGCIHSQGIPEAKGIDGSYRPVSRGRGRGQLLRSCIPSGLWDGAVCLLEGHEAWATLTLGDVVLAFSMPPTYCDVWSWTNSACFWVSGSAAINRNQSACFAFPLEQPKCWRGYEQGRRQVGKHHRADWVGRDATGFWKVILVLITWC